MSNAFQEGINALENRNYERAYQDFQQAKEYATSIASQEALLTTEFYLGLSAQLKADLGRESSAIDLDQAILHYKETLSQDPEHILAINNLALALSIVCQGTRSSTSTSKEQACSEIDSIYSSAYEAKRDLSPLIMKNYITWLFNSGRPSEATDVAINVLSLLPINHVLHKDTLGLAKLRGSNYWIVLAGGLIDQGKSILSNEVVFLELLLHAAGQQDLEADGSYLHNLTTLYVRTFVDNINAKELIVSQVNELTRLAENNLSSDLEVRDNSMLEVLNVLRELAKFVGNPNLKSVSGLEWLRDEKRDVELGQPSRKQVLRELLLTLADNQLANTGVSSEQAEAFLVSSIDLSDSASNWAPFVRLGAVYSAMSNAEGLISLEKSYRQLPISHTDDRLEFYVRVAPLYALLAESDGGSTVHQESLRIADLIEANGWDLVKEDNPSFGIDRKIRTASIYDLAPTFKALSSTYTTEELGDARLAALEKELIERDRNIAAMRGQLENAQNKLCSKTGGGNICSANMDLHPPNPRPGECYARVILPAKYETTSETITVREASERMEVVPAKYASGTERVLVKPASSRLETIPASYKTVEERILVRPASTRLEQVPATYKTVEERIVVKPASIRTEFIPATNKTVQERVLIKPATTRFETIPAQYGPGSERVEIQPASTRIQTIPAVYETRNERVLVRPESTSLVSVPAEYRTVTERVLDKPATTEWKRGTGIGTGAGVDFGGAAAQVKRYGETGQRILETRVDDTGEVMCLVEVPATYKTVSKQVLVKPAYTKTVTVPAEYSTITTEVLVKPATTREIVVPAQYASVDTTVVVKPETTREVSVPAEYATVSKQVIDTPASVREIPIPAEYMTISKRVIDRPASVREVPVPAEYKTVTKRVIDRPASTREVLIPAVYSTVETIKLVAPASERRIPIPAEMRTVTNTRKLTDEAIEWRPVLCEINMTAANVSSLQAALQKTGCCKCGPNRNECEIDGILGRCTLNAARCYANRKGLPSGDKYVTIEVIRSLGLKF